MKKVAVLFGGKSCEREISVLTGVFVANVLSRSGFEPIPVYFHSDLKAYSAPEFARVEAFKDFEPEKYSRVLFEGGSLYKYNEKRGRLKFLAKVDVAINCCHGGWGEGGGVSALMEQNNVPLASPTLAPSGVFLDKSLTKILSKGLEIPTLPYLRVSECDYLKRGAFLVKNIGVRLGYPVVVKPNSLGSSIGITLATTEEEAKKALELAFRLDEVAIVEKYLEGKSDVNCAAYCVDCEIVVSEPEIASSGEGVYTFSDKYLKDKGLLSGSGESEDGGMDEETVKKIKRYTKTLYKKSGSTGVLRVDYLVRGKEVYLSEVNSVPGSLAYYLFCERLTDARAFFTDLLTEALSKSEKEEKTLLETGVLNTVRIGGKRSKR